MSSRKFPTPIRSGTSTESFEAITASQRAHINELVQKTHTLEQKAKRLEDSLQRQAEVHYEQLEQARAEWQAERVQWRDGCESLQVLHRIAHSRTTCLLQDERRALLKERDISRKQRIAVLQRDFQLTMFQAKETELEAKVDELEESLERSQHEVAQLVMEWRSKFTGVLDEVKEKAELLAEAEAARSAAQKETSRLREEQAVLKSKVATAASEHERTSHRLQESENTHAELKARCQELEHANADLKSQVDKWRASESKGGAEVNSERKKRIDLEVEVRELKTHLASLDESLQEETASVEKGRKKLEKVKDALADQARMTEEAQQEAKQLQEELQTVRRANQQLQQSNEEQIRQLKASSSGEGDQDAKHERMMSKLTLLLENQARETAKAKQKAMKHENDAEQVKKQLSDALKRNEELEAKMRASTHARSLSIATRSPQSVAVEEQEVVDSPRIPSPEPKGRPRPRPAPRVSGFSATAKMMEDATPPRPKKASVPIDSDIEEISPIPTKVKPKKTKALTPVEIEEDDDVEPVKKPKSKKAAASKTATQTAADRNGKRKVAADEDEEDAVAAVVKPKRRKKVVEAEDRTRSDDEPPRSKPASKQTDGPKAKKGRPANKESVQGGRASGTPDDGEGVAPKKKTFRKLNAFSSAQPQSFDWMRIGAVGTQLRMLVTLAEIHLDGGWVGYTARIVPDQGFQIGAAKIAFWGKEYFAHV
ncbi:hypothetical protein EVG20_g2547 [Dentipellis fragilis]|uniref:Uncharacterized protein n=1 Tax=Dentipellis fragilis TaxID=205917 RepID=A0A4Y9Z9F2_9AGAM|nr:hypothetical protein EVG20_g2547 [Dentipellis fragilis]